MHCKTGYTRFFLFWSIIPTVDAFELLEDVPLGYWSIVITDNISENALGVHLGEHG